ncbi:hypothetical protein BU23DRAFT_472615, partial [Bimuria novae-zelandiae CBS 107.79]
KSSLYNYRYRVTLRANMQRIFFVYRYYYIHKVPKTTSSTSSAWNHVEQRRPGHRHFRPGK